MRGQSTKVWFYGLKGDKTAETEHGDQAGAFYWERISLFSMSHLYFLMASTPCNMGGLGVTGMHMHVG